MQKGCAIIAAIIVAIIAIIAAQPDKPVTLRSPERSVTAAELASAYASNEMAAKRDFEKEPFKLTGKVYSVTDDGNVLMNNGINGILGTNMVEGHDAQIIDLKRGDTFTADCEGALSFAGTLTALHCRPSSPAAAAS